VNGFEQHNIHHLSPSSLNLWINAPDRWVAEKLFGKHRPAGFPALRGQAVESVVVDTLLGEAFSTAVDVAVTKFDEHYELDTPKIAKERDMIEPMAANALELLEGFGAPVFADNNPTEQIRVEKYADLGASGKIRFIGYLDLVFPHAIVDIKSTGRILSVMPAEHQRQRAFYHACTGRETSFLYCSPKRAELKADGDVAHILAEMKFHAGRLERLLRDRTREEVAELVPVNTNTFYWSDCQQDAHEIFGLPVPKVA
jgi:hypothetical protein